jgi:hypothetical protein
MLLQISPPTIGSPTRSPSWEVYASSNATGGAAHALAAAIFKDLDEHVGIKGNRLLQAQGRVMVASM